MTDHNALGDETPDSLTGLGKGVRNALLIELALGLIVWLLIEVGIGLVIRALWRFAT